MTGQSAKPVGQDQEKDSRKHQRQLRVRIVAVLLVVSLSPLALVGMGAWVNFGGLLEEKSIELHRSVVLSHARSIDRYLSERFQVLDLLARTHSLDKLTQRELLRRLLDQVNVSYGMSFVDLGVIDADGRHLGYAGPYRLENQNYAGEKWFKEVMQQGSYLSDVFLGFRRLPHCVIAIKRQHQNRPWILRATINSAEFEKLVQTGRLAQTGDAFLVNSRGFLQTPSRSGRVLELSPVCSPQAHPGVREVRVGQGAATLLRATTWINQGRWLLVVQQEAAEIAAPVRQAALVGSLVILLAVVLVVATTILATLHLTNRIDRAIDQRDRLSRDLLRSAKLASLGEMSSGLAHEINNPLAIISALQTNIADLGGDLPADTPGLDDIQDAVTRSKKQVSRCGNITAKMLQFGRKSETQVQPTDIAARLEEIVGLMKTHAEVNQNDLKLEVEPGLPPLLVDATELEQVVVNLINNAMQASNGHGEITVKAQKQGKEVLLSVTDRGQGIAPADLERIFQPFFTTKAPGKGTGLGLSVCYGIVRGWGGSIDAASVPGQGTQISIHLPVPAATGSRKKSSGGTGHG